MFLDVPAALFVSDGVSADLVRAGEPRVRRSTRPAAVVQPVAVRRRAAFGRLIVPTSS